MKSRPLFLAGTALLGLSCLAGATAVDSSASSATTGFAWTKFSVAGHRLLNAISCPSASFCVASDDQGDVVVSHHPTVSAKDWIRFDVDRGASIDPIDCAATTLCVATDGQEILVSTAPSAGPAGWRLVSIPGLGQGNAVMAGVSCPTVSLCVVGDDAGDVIASAHPGAGAGSWRAINLDSGVTDNPGTNNTNGASCAGIKLCVVVDGNDAIYTSTDPLAGAKSWHDTDLSDLVADDGHGDDLAGVSCPSVSLCLVGDVYGDALVSVHPTGGPSAWRLVHLANESEISGFSCPSIHFCAAVDTLGDLLYSSDPAGGASSWTRAKIDSPHSLEDVSCPTTKLCVAVDDQGFVMVGRSAIR